jgi:hypothetical protein
MGDHYLLIFVILVDSNSVKQIVLFSKHTTQKIK